MDGYKVTGYLIEVKNEEASYRVTIANFFIANIPEDGKTYMKFEKDLVTIQNITIFAGRLSNWGAIKWGIIGIVKPKWYRLTRKKWIR